MRLLVILEQIGFGALAYTAVTQMQLPALLLLQKLLIEEGFSITVKGLLIILHI